MTVSLTSTAASVSSLAADEVELLDGLFPTSNPGATTYPGRGNTIGGGAVTVTTLTTTGA